MLLGKYQDVIQVKPRRTSATAFKLKQEQYIQFTYLTSEKEAKGVLENGFIEPSTSRWASPVIARGRVHLCVDYRECNSETTLSSHWQKN